jgi:hypothetical protein
VVITGSNFVPVPTARLGSSTYITITAATANTLTGTVPAGLVPGVYALTVTNPDAQSDTLSPAYTALNPPSPDTTLETGYLSTFGPGAPTSAGDDDHVQVIFFEVPDSTAGNLYLRIFDADTGGGTIIETIDKPNLLYNTTMTYTLRGDGGYTPDSRTSHPSPVGINAGTLLTQTAVGADPTYHDNWNLVFGPYVAGDGQLVGSSRIFKLVVQGASGDDGNYYNVTLSTDPTSNAAPAGGRVFAYSWTFPLAPFSTQWLYPYIPAATSSFIQYNWDMDTPDGTMALHTLIQDFAVPGSGISGDGNAASSAHSVQALEDEATWTAVLSSATATWNDLTFWATGDGADLAIFTRPTTSPPP